MNAETLISILRDPKQHTVKALRQSGFKVRVGHKRWIRTFGSVTGHAYWTFDWTSKVAIDKDLMYPYGGETHMSLMSDAEQVDVVIKCSRADRFVRKVGLQMALGRALPELARRMGIEEEKP